MPEQTGYNATTITQITRAINELSEAIESLEEGEAKSALLDSVATISETASTLETSDQSPEDAMMESDTESLDFGEATPFQPEKANARKKSSFGVQTEEM